MSTEFNKVKSGVIFTKAAQKQDLQSGDTIPEALGKIAKYMDVTDDALSNIQPILTFDSEPEYESLNPVTSGGLYDYIELQSPTYINTFSTESDLYSYSGNLTNNDYAFVGTGSGATYYMNVYQYKSEVIRDTIENIKTVPSGSNILKTLNEPALPSGNIQYKLDCYVTAVNNQSYGTSPVISVIFSDNTTAQITVPNANKTHIVKTYSKPINAIQFMNSGQASDGYTEFEDIQILTTAGWNKLSYRLYNPTWDANQLSAINSGITSTKVTNYDNHIANKSNPHEVTKSQVGLGNVGNFKAVSTEASQGLTTTEQSNARTNINAQESLSFNGTYNASTNKVATESTVTNAINALDVSSQGGAGKYISEISETNGKISATPTTMDTSLSNSSTNNNCPTSKTVYDDQQRQDIALAEVENKGAKNKIYNKIHNVGESVTTNGFTFTQQDDGGIKIEYASTSSTNSDYYMAGTFYGTAIQFDLSDDDYAMSLTTKTAVSSEISNKIRIRLYDRTVSPELKTHVYLNAPPMIFSPHVTVVFITIDKPISNFPAEGIVVYPMICTKAEWDISQAYVPYGKTNAELTSDISALFTENTSQQAEINYAINTGAKNLIKLNPNTYTSGNVVVKLNDDCTVSVSLSSGSTANTTFSRAIKTITNLRDMDLILNGCPSGGNYSSGYALYISDNGTTKEKDEGNGVLVPKNTTVTTSYLALIVRSGTAISGTLTFKPMIRPASITDSTFQPYALPNPVLTPALIDQVDEGAKNICNWMASTSTIEHVTFTINSDKTVSTSGTATARSQKPLTFTVPSTLKAGRYVLSGCPTGGEQSGTVLYCLYIWDNTANARVCLNDTGNGIEFDWTPDASHTYTVAVDVRSGTNASGLIFKPMICTASDWAVSQKFVPYAPTNRELYEEKIGIEEVFGSGTKIEANTNFNDIKTHGLYYSTSTQDIGSFTNCPVSAQFTLSVKFGSQAVFQEIQPMSKAEIMYRYVRMFTNGTWSSWYKFEGTEVTS